ncbi:hypothetical protein CC79DRAFT_1363655 [Sarocladium strictum]
MDILDANFGILGMPGPKISSEDKITLLRIFGFTENHVFDLKRTHLRVDPTHKDNLEEFQYRYWALPEDILIVGKSETEQKLDDITQGFANMTHISNSYFDGMQQMNASRKKLQTEFQELEGRLAAETAIAMTSATAQQSANTKSQLVIACQEASEEADDEGDTSVHTHATAGIVKSQINCNGKRVVQRTPMECIAKKMRAT